MMLTSTRVRLTLWNVAVVAIVLAIVATILRYTLEARLIAAVDHRISMFATDLATPDNEPPPPGERPPGGPNGPGPWAGEPFRPRMHRHGFGHRPSDELPPAVMDPSGYPIEGGTEKAIIDQPSFNEALLGRTAFTTIAVKNKPTRVCSVPIRKGTTIVGVVQVARNLTTVFDELRDLRRTVLLVSPFALLLAALCGAFLTGHALRPVRDFTNAARTIGADNLGSRLPVTGGDEFAELASTFNATLDRLQDAFGALGESLEQQRRLTADASHELRTPLTVIKAHTSLTLSTKRTAAQYKETLGAIDQAADTMSRIVQDLLLLARADAGQLTIQHDLVRLADATGMAVDEVAALDGPDVQPGTFDTELSVPGDAHLLSRVFTNILSNAKRHTPATGSVTIDARREGDRAIVQIRDTGEGIPSDALSHLGERFYRVDTARARTGGGTGLGLAICRTIVEAHGGTLRIDSVIGKGTVVTVELPAG